VTSYLALLGQTLLICWTKGTTIKQTVELSTDCYWDAK